MPLPPFTESGDLPLGVHRAAFHEVGERFGSGTPQRRRVFLRLERRYSIARGTGHLARMIVFGSFVTTKVEPNEQVKRDGQRRGIVEIDLGAS